MHKPSVSFYHKTQLHAQQGHRAWIYASSVSPDGTLLASCGSDGIIQLWNISQATHYATLRSERPYEALDVTNAPGLSEAQKASLKLLGAFENGSLHTTEMRLKCAHGRISALGT